MTLKMQRRGIWSLLGPCLVGGFFGAAPAHAESDATARALAVQLFDQAEALLAKGHVAAACPKYAESFRLDPQLGALIYLAECYEKNGQLASAWGTFREAEEMAQKRRDDRAAHAHERATALQPRLDSLSIRVPESVRVPGLEVLRDGVLLSETVWDSAAPIDSGKHRIEARAVGYKPWRRTVDISGTAQLVPVDIPLLQVDPNASAHAEKPVVSSPGSGQRTTALVIGSAGIVGLGVGAFFGLSAQSSWGETKDLCNEKDICTERGHELRTTAKNKALVATVATGVGAAGLATALIIWFTAPKGESPAAPGSAAARRDRRWVITPNRTAWGLEVAGAF
ncbi:MAG: hypothetical protein ABIQ16_10830 [Polyangiaceae bacterium]